MFNQRSRMNRKNQIVVNLIQTPLGYSIVEGDDLINKASTSAIVHQPKERLPHVPPKRQNVIVPIYPYTNSKPIDHPEEKYTTLPASASWFSLTSVHETQKKALGEWFRTRKQSSSASKMERYEKNEQLYKKYRNYIVELSKQGYVSASRARKGLAGDACSIMRIHAFLEHWGIINYMAKDQLISNGTHTTDLIMKFNEEEKLDMFEFDKMLIPKSYSQEDTEILKRLTKKYRPLCDFCGQRCGIVWFQHRRSLSAKQIAKIMKNVNLKNPPLSSTEYEIILCIKCYSDGNFPIILSSNDFSKMTINQKLAEGKSKKKNREPSELQPEVEWTQDEVSLLLDLVSKMGDKWSEIATHFKNRTEQEVVMCFLNLPLKQISRLKIEMQPDEFVKENFDELCNNFSSTIAQTALNMVHMEEAQANNKSAVMTNGTSAAHNDHSSKDAEQERTLFNQLLRLYIKKIDNKLELLQEWESAILDARKSIEEGRKSVIAQKIRNIASK